MLNSNVSGKKTSFGCWKKSEHKNLMRLWDYIGILITFKFHADIFPQTNFKGCRSYLTIHDLFPGSMVVILTVTRREIMNLFALALNKHTVFNKPSLNPP